jgi:hypothetical protein
LEKQAKETARRWLSFANGKEPGGRYFGGAEGGEGRTAVCDDRVGWEERTRQEDERVSEHDAWGGRRYREIEMLAEVWRGLEEGEVERRRKMLIDIGKFLG